MNKLITFIALIFILQTGIIFAGNDWLVREHSNKTGKGHSEHGQGYGFGHDREAFVLFKDGKIKGDEPDTNEVDSCNEATVQEPQDDWSFEYVEGNPVEIYGGTYLVERARDGDGVLVQDLLSDGSYDLYPREEDSQYYSCVSNTERGIQELTIFFDNGMPQYQINYQYNEFEIYEMDGTRRVRIDVLQEKSGTVYSLITGTETTEENIDLYNQYFK